MRSYLTEQEFLRLYDLYLKGRSLYTIADDHWQKHGYASPESFRLAFRSRCKRRNYPVRDVSASRRKKPEQLVQAKDLVRQSKPLPDITVTPEVRELLRQQVSERRKLLTKGREFV